MWWYLKTTLWKDAQCTVRHISTMKLVMVGVTMFVVTLLQPQQEVLQRLRVDLHIDVHIIQLLT